MGVYRGLLGRKERNGMIGNMVPIFYPPKLSETSGAKILFIFFSFLVSEMDRRPPGCNLFPGAEVVMCE